VIFVNAVKQANFRVDQLFVSLQTWKNCV